MLCCAVVCGVWTDNLDIILDIILVYYTVYYTDDSKLVYD